MICAHDEVMAPKVHVPVMNHLDKPNQFVFIGGELEVAHHEWLTEECHDSIAMMEHCPKTRA